MKYVLIVLLGFSALSFSQEKTQDSIKSLLTQHITRDSIRVTRLLNLAYSYRANDTEKAERYLDEALEIAKEIRDPLKEGITRRFLAQHFKRKGNFDLSLSNAIRSVELLDSVQAKKEERLLSNSELTIAYQNSDYIEEALQMALKNLKAVENDPISPSKGRYYYDVGNAYYHLKDYKNAEMHYLTAVDICEKTNFIPGKMMMLSTLATVYKANKQYSKAKEAFLEALPYYEQTGNKRNIASTKHQLGTIESMQGNHAESIALYEEALALFEDLGSLHYRQTINQKLFVAYSILGEQEKAEAANIIYNATRDSINSNEQKTIIADMKTKYETDKISAEKEAAQAKAALAEARSNRNRNLLIGALLIAGLILISSLLYIGRVRATKKAQLVTIELKETQKPVAREKQYRDSELKALKAQMNPHFIFNALNSIQEYIILNKKDLAGDYLGMFADLMRKYLHHSDAGSLTLQDEIESLQMYLDLEKLRFEDTLMFNLDVSEEINKEITRIPTMLIQPYIENALKHGLLHKKENRKLWVTFSQKDEKTILCSIEDNGIGRKKSADINVLSQKKHKSFATKATENRLNLLNYGKDRKIGVEILDLFNEDKTVKGTKVTLTIPTVTV